MQGLLSSPEDVSLLREISHRHSNALQILSSSLARIESSTDTTIPLHEVRRFRKQIILLAELNRRLSTSPAYVDLLSDYLEELGRLVLGAFDRPDISLEISIVDARLTADRQMKLGLLVVELITNAIKHGGGEEAAEIISVDLAWCGAARLELRVTNPASGRHSAIQVPRIATELARTLQGELRVSSAAYYAASVRFAVAEPAPPTPVAQPGMPGRHGCPRNKVFHWRPRKS